MPQGEDKFCPMTLNGVTYKEKADAGGMLLAICKGKPAVTSRYKSAATVAFRWRFSMIPSMHTIV